MKDIDQDLEMEELQAQFVSSFADGDMRLARKAWRRMVELKQARAKAPASR